MAFVAVDPSQIKFDAPDALSTAPAAPQGFVRVDPSQINFDKPDFINRVGADLVKRANEGADAIVAYKNGDQGLTQTALQLAGKMGAAPILDIGGEAVKSAYTSLPQTAQDYINNKATQAGNYIANTDVGKAGIEAAREAGEAYQQFAKNNPNAARTVESIGDVASVLPVGKAVETAAQPISDAAKGAEGLADAYAAKYPNATPFDKITPKVETPVTADALNVASSLRYQEMRDAGATLNQGGIDFVNKSVDDALKGSGLMNERLHGDTMSVIKDLKNDAGSGTLDLEKLDQYRQLLGNVVTDNTTKLEGMNQDALKAQTAIKAIDDAVDNIGQQHLTAGTSQAVDALNQARDLYSARARLNTLQRITDNAYMTDNPATAMRTGFRNLAKQVNVSPRGWTPEEVDAINKAAKTGIVAGALKTMGGRLMSGIVGGVAGAAGGGVIGAMAGVPIAEAAAYPMRAAANALQEARGNAVAKLVANRPAIAQALPQNIKDIMQLPPAQAREALNALRAQQLRTNFVPQAVTQ